MPCVFWKQDAPKELLPGRLLPGECKPCSSAGLNSELVSSCGAFGHFLFQMLPLLFGGRVLLRFNRRVLLDGRGFFKLLLGHDRGGKEA
jgi:hypothetical protein